MTLIYQISIKINGNPSEIIKRYPFQIVDFKKIYNFCKMRGVEFIDSGIDADGTLNLMIECENSLIENFEQALDIKHKRIATNKEVYSWVENNFEAGNIQQELTGIHK